MGRRKMGRMGYSDYSAAARWRRRRTVYRAAGRMNLRLFAIDKMAERAVPFTTGNRLKRRFGRQPAARTLSLTLPPVSLKTTRRAG